MAHAGHIAGGLARAAKLSPARRAEIARLAAEARWSLPRLLNLQPKPPKPAKRKVKTMRAAEADRQQIETLMIAAETYVVAVIRSAFATQHVEVHVDAVSNARVALLDQIEAIDRVRQ